MINWYPPEVGTGRFGEWLKNNVDWAISRDRFWGTPLNIWVCEDCNHMKSVGSIAELKEHSQQPIKDSEVDLHKHFVDDITFKCDSCGGVMKRTPEVVDVWFDSGAMPFAQWHYPFENQELFEKSFPADFICEGIDQTRGWFYSLLAISTMLMDQPSYKNVVVNELILDKEGRKMSKRLGNTVVPAEIIKKYGVDAIRWYMVYLSPPWVTKRFDEEGVKEAQRKFFGTLINIYSFFSLYANIDQFDAGQEPVSMADRREIDRWVLSRLYTVADRVTEHLEKYEINKAARMINNFVIDEVSNWYVRRNRRRFWKSEMGEDKLAAYQTLYSVLFTVAKMIAPFTPFFAEELYQNLAMKNQQLSVHMTSFPEPDMEQKRIIDTELENRMAVTQQIVYLARGLRNEVQIKVRQPLEKIMIHVHNDAERVLIEKMKSIIMEEINIKEIEFATDINLLANLSCKPNFKTLGRKAGKLMKSLNNVIRNFSPADLALLQEKGEMEVEVETSSFTLKLEDVEIVSSPKEGMVVATEGQLTVALDTHISEELRNEGIARELVNRIQNFRKDTGLEITDRIMLTLELPRDLELATQHLESYIKQETLAEKINYGEDHYDTKTEITIETIEFNLSLKKV